MACASAEGRYCENYRRRVESQSWASSPGVARSMRGNRRRDTKPELAVRRGLHARGLRFRVDYRPIQASRSRADVVFTRLRLAIFIDGCFWHGCPLHATIPVTNSDYWIPKLKRNAERDRETEALLRAAEWAVLRFWEHEPIPAVVDAIASAVAGLRDQRGGAAR